ncbi:MAG: hypothetical protein V4446_14550 [Pseudomonadota bacterium]
MEWAVQSRAATAKEKCVFTLNIFPALPDKKYNGGLNAWPYQGQTKVDGI